METIGKDAFSYNSSLKEIALPATLQSIADDGFYGCEALEQIICMATVPLTCGNWSVFRYVDTNQCKLVVPDGSVNAYKAADVWKDFFNIFDIETGISGTSADKPASPQWFNLSGRSLGAPQKGLNIVRQNGKAKKFINR